MTWLLSYWKPLALVAVLLCAFASGWLSNGWRLGQQIEQQQAAFQTDLSTINLAAAKAQQDANEQHQALAKAVQQDSATRYQEYTDAQRQNAQLRADLLTAQRRLSVRISGCSSSTDVSTAAGTGGVDHEAGRADLDTGSADRIVAIANRGDDAIRQLMACQGYVRKILGE
ncbi:lysis system i-spanin subunit Rz [Pseudomonas citronellolis]|uniref:lysis system i-spanin subunit Rz n=1 Tax=Pseudomonas citronellolis TaxID=53408 RepID=UPI0026485CCD|nr:lysis system i-spanin subunit Rz [Pseudomonas citronellolis]MDN6874070.1 lysis system i-spanin subunit Rz [Pseudomonas citronellolis]